MIIHYNQCYNALPDHKDCLFIIHTFSQMVGDFYKYFFCVGFMFFFFFPLLICNFFNGILLKVQYINGSRRVWL